MKNTKTRLTAILLALLLTLSAFVFASCDEDEKPDDGAVDDGTSEDNNDTEAGDSSNNDASSNGLIFELNEDGTGYMVFAAEDFEGESIVIPSEHEGLPVIDFYFKNCSTLTSVTIPNSITKIGFEAFDSCSSLTNLIIPDSVTCIDEGAFYGCNNLESITLGNNIEFIADKAFYGCSKLQYNEYDNAYYLGNKENPYVALVTAKSTDIKECAIHPNTKTICNRAFEHCTLESITIPDGITNINWSAFYGCNSLTSISLPNSITRIEYSIFTHCNNLTSITIPDSVTHIDYLAFGHCSSLTSITIPNSVTSIGDDAFSECTSLHEINFDGTKAQWKAFEYDLTYIGAHGKVICTDGEIEY